MPAKGPPSKGIFFRVDVDLYNTITAAAGREERSVPFMFVRAMKAWLYQPPAVMAPAYTSPEPAVQPALLHTLTDAERLLDLIDTTLREQGVDLADGRRVVMWLVMLNAWISFRSGHVDRKTASAGFYRGIATLKDRGRIDHDKTMIWRVTQ